MYFSPDEGVSSGVPQAKKVPPQLYIADPTSGHFPSQAAVYVSEVPPKQDFEICCNEHSPTAYVHQKNETSPRGNPPYRPAVVYNFEQPHLPNQDSELHCNYRSKPSNVEVIRNRLSGNPRHGNWDHFDSEESADAPAKVHNWQRGAPFYEVNKKINTERISYNPNDFECQTDDASNGNGLAINHRLNAIPGSIPPFTYSGGGSLESLKYPKRYQNSTRILPGMPVRNVGGSFNDIYRGQVCYNSTWFSICHV